MALVLKDRVKETTSTQGTGAITLLGPAQGYQGFSAIGNGNTTYYCIAGTTEWEVGIGTYNSGSLTRDTVLGSSNNNSLVGFSAGVKDVFCTYAADKAVSTDTLPVLESLNTDTPNATVNAAVLTAATVSTNGDLVLKAKGTGALLAEVPDNAISGGNKRGIYAVDWQMARANVLDVASGASSTISGGYANRASGGWSAVGGGDYNWSTGLESVIAGGYANVASASWSTVGGGIGNDATGQGSSVLGGLNNEATGLYSAVMGGVYGKTRGVTGYHAFPACYAPISSTAGATQAGMLLLGVQTTDATPTVLRSTTAAAGTANQFILQNNMAAMLNIAVFGWDGTDFYTVDVTNAMITRGLGVATTVYSAGYYQFLSSGSGTSGWGVAFAADTTNGGLKITVTGASSKTIRWVARILSTEVQF